MPFDVTDWAQVQASLNGTDGLDILINNAGNAGTEGFADLRPFVESEPGDWERYIRVNLYGVMNCTRAALPGMIGRTERPDRHDRVRRRTVRGRLHRPVRSGKSRCSRDSAAPSPERSGATASLSTASPWAPCAHPRRLPREILHRNHRDRTRDLSSTSSGGEASPKMRRVSWRTWPALRRRGSPARPIRSTADTPCPSEYVTASCPNQPSRDSLMPLSNTLAAYAAT